MQSPESRLGEQLVALRGGIPLVRCSSQTHGHRRRQGVAPLSWGAGITAAFGSLIAYGAPWSSGCGIAPRQEIMIKGLLKWAVANFFLGRVKISQTVKHGSVWQGCEGIAAG